MNEEKLYQIALANISGIGSVTIKNLVRYCGSAKKVFETSKGKLATIPGIGTFTANNIGNPDLDLAKKELNRAKRLGVEVLSFTDPNYPNRLKQVTDAPTLLYTTNSNYLTSKRMVAIVGARKATSYGLGMVRELVQGLKKHKATIVSGLAYGIDIEAHKEAIKQQLPTLGVMASGIDIVYPAAHKQVAQAMRANGALLSENKFSTKPDAPRFPARNRIIAGLVDAVIVVEAARKGGALITAEIANSYNRDVFAVPGDAHRPMSIGCNHLIKSNKAHLLDIIEDLEYIMNWTSTDQVTKKSTLNYKELDNQEAAIVSLFEENRQEMLIDEISYTLQINGPAISALLLQLEFKGWIKSLPGKKYRLNH